MARLKTCWSLIRLRLIGARMEHRLFFFKISFLVFYISVLIILEHCPHHMLTRRDVKSDPTQVVMAGPTYQLSFIGLKLI